MLANLYICACLLTYKFIFVINLFIFCVCVFFNLYVLAYLYIFVHLLIYKFVYVSCPLFYICIFVCVRVDLVICVSWLNFSVLAYLYICACSLIYEFIFMTIFEFLNIYCVFVDLCMLFDLYINLCLNWFINLCCVCSLIYICVWVR